VRLTVTAQRGEELTATDVYAKVNPSVVTVVAEEKVGASVGTGVIMPPDGYIITNAHVISGGKSCWIALDTGATYDAKLVGVDEEEDLAVLKAVDAQNLPAAEFGDSDLLTVGEKAYAIGNPLGIELRGTLTDGIISAVNRQIQVEDGYMTMIQTTAALNNGNSGGPLINSSGQIIGINTLKMGGSGWKGEATVEGLGFALPISSVCFVVNDLIATGEFRGVPTIGISVITSMDDKGGAQVEVYSVEETMGAAKAGIQAGDIILAADGVPVSRIEDLQVVRRSHNIGDTVTLTILRNGRTMDIDVVLYSNKGK
jgi:serine protease Do